MIEPGNCLRHSPAARGAPGSRSWFRRGRPGAARISIAALLSVALSCCGSGETARGTEESLRSNLALIRTITGEIGAVVMDSAGRGIRDTVILDVESSAAAWIARTEFAAVLGSAGRRVLAGTHRGASATKWSVRGVELGVEYRDIRKSGMFSAPVVDRVVSASITSEITSGDVVVYAGTVSRSLTDTVPESRIGELEARTEGITTGKVPDLRSIDRFIEPFVIIGATGAAILLFFQVRS